MADLHYDAFISYRHTPRDIEVAKKIQTSLERFRVPAAIKDKYHFEGFKRIFRDQEELVINSNLAKEIEEAINASDYLIVICSPHYMESKWCLLEIETFLKNHDRDHVLCVLSEGEPPAIFPDTLCHYSKVSKVDGKEIKEEVNCEPLACDFRGDMKQAIRSELPRLASAMIGCGYDELMLRKERYRRKQMLILFSIIFTLVSIALLYLLWSNNQINRNYRQSQINESKVLSKESLDYLEQKDRLKAIETALDALPVNNDRPLTDEAQFALAKASFAYNVPYNYLESWRIDEANDIVDYFISSDQNYLVYLENNGSINTISLNDKKKETSFVLSENARRQTIQEGKQGQLITYHDGVVMAFDYLSGKQEWSQALNYQVMELVRVSNNRQLVAAGDSNAIQVMDINGVPEASFRLPEDIDGYVYDFCWSKDDKKFGVVIRHTDSTYTLAVIDYESGEFKKLSDNYGKIIDFEFTYDGTLYLLATSNSTSTYFTQSNEYYFNGNYSFLSYKDNKQVFNTTIENSGELDKVKVLERNDNEIILVLGSDIYLIGKDGKINKDYTLSSSINTILQNNEEYLDVLCRNGYRGTVWLDSGDACLERSFPENISDLKLVNGANLIQSKYIILNKGDLAIYESLYDDSISFIDGQGFYYPPDEIISSSNKMVVKSYNQICFVDMTEEKIQESKALNEGEYYHLLDIVDDHVYILHILEDGNSVLQEYDWKATLLNETKLDLYDETISRDVLNYPLSRTESIYLDNNYAENSSFVVKDHKLYMHDLNKPNTIRIYDLISKEEKSVEADLKTSFMVNTKGYFYPSELLVSPEGNKIFSVAHDFENGYEFNAYLIDTENSETNKLTIAPGEGFCGDMSDDKLFYSSSDAIVVSDLKGSVLYQIPYTGQRAVNMKYHNGLLYVIYPQGELIVYKDDRQIRTISLSGEDLSKLDHKQFKMIFTEKEILVIEEDCLDVISLDSDSSSPLFQIPRNALTYFEDQDKYLLYSYDPKKIDTYYRLATYKRQPIDSLIQRAQIQLEEYKIKN